MAVYRVKDEAGNNFRLEGPDNATDDELKSAIDSYIQGSELAPEVPRLLDQGQQTLSQGLSQAEKQVANTPMGITASAFDLAKQASGKIGEMGSEALARKGVNPYISAGIGTVAAFAPDIIAAASAPAELGASKLRNMATKSKLPGTLEQLSSARSLKAAEPIKAINKRQVLEDMLHTSRKSLEALEKEYGLGLKKIPSIPKDTAGFAEAMRSFSDKTPEQLLEVLPIEELQNLKKIAQVTKRGALLPEESAFINKGVERIDQAIGMKIPALAEELSRFRQISDVLEEITPNLRKQAAGRTAQIARLSEKAKGEGSVLKDALRLGLRAAGLRSIVR